MISGFIRGQELTLASPIIAAGTVDYLTARFMFDGDDWDGAEKYAVWYNDAVAYEIPLIDDRIGEAAHLNLSAGVWRVYIRGDKSEGGQLIQRITTSKAEIEVKSIRIYGGVDLMCEIERIHERINSLESSALHPIRATSDMTQPVGCDSEGRLYTNAICIFDEETGNLTIGG